MFLQTHNQGLRQVLSTGVHGTPRLTLYISRWPCISAVPKATHEARLKRPWLGALSAQKALRGFQWKEWKRTIPFPDEGAIEQTCIACIGAVGNGLATTALIGGPGRGVGLNGKDKERR